MPMSYTTHHRCVSPRSGRPVEQHGANMADRLGRIQALRANIDAILDPVTPEDAKGVIQLGQAVFCCSIAAVGKEPIGLQQTRGTDKAVGFPPKRRAAGRATRTENALIQAV